MKRPLFAAGLTAFTALLLCMTLEQIWISIISVMVFVAGMVVCIIRRERWMKSALALTAAWVAAALVFFAHYYLRVLPSFVLCGNTAAVEGRLEEAPTESEKSLCLRLRHCKINGRQTNLSVTVYVRPGMLADAALYDTLSFPKVDLRDAPERDAFFFHGLSNDAWLSGWAYTGEITAHYTGHSPFYRVALLRQRAQETLQAALTPARAEIAAALLLGENGRLSSAFKSRLRVAGASHLFAVSGMHLALWTAALFLLFRKRARNKRWANAVAIGFVLFYAALTGFSPSVLRAGIMLITVFAGRMRRLAADGLNSLGLSALCLLAVDPFLAGNVSFLLSFFATAAILILTPFFNVSVSGRPSPAVVLQRNGAAAVNGVTLSLGVLFFTVPISGLFFGSVSLLSPVSSVICVLPAEGVMLTGAAGLLSHGFSPVSAFCFRLCGGCADLLSRAVERIARADFLYIGVRAPYILLWYVLTLAPAVAVYYLLHKEKQAVINLLLLSASFVLLAGGTLRLTQARSARLILPDAGNATAVCLQFGGGGACFIGAGETYDGTRAALDRFTDEGILLADVLILPDGAPAESGQAEYVGSACMPRAVFSAAQLEKFFPDAETYRNAANFRLTMPDGWVYHNRLTDGLRAGVLSGSKRVVFSYSPANDFTNAWPTFRSGDCLVCRAGIPKGVDPADFTVIFVLTDKSSAALSLPENACSVHDLGGVSLLL